MKKSINKSSFFNQFDFYRQSQQSLLEKLHQHLQFGQDLKIVFTPNPEQLVQASYQFQFAQALKQADYLLPDGIGLVWASRFLSEQKFAQIKERITGVEVAQALLSFAQNKQLRVLIIGGQNYQDFVSNSQIFSKLKSTYQLKSNLYWNFGYKDVKDPQPEEEAKLKQILSQLKPDIIFVAFGAPWQEQWVVEHQKLLAANKVKLAMVVGGAFDFIFGKVKRAPDWLQTLGLEWLYRLIKQPWRFKRQLRLIEFSCWIFKQKLS